MIDFVDPMAWPAFNLADACIVVGVLALLRGRGHGPGAQAGAQRTARRGSSSRTTTCSSSTSRPGSSSTRPPATERHARRSCWRAASPAARTRRARHRPPARPRHLGPARASRERRGPRRAAGGARARARSRASTSRWSRAGRRRGRGTIDAPIGRDRRVRTRMSTDTDNPREARTHFEIERGARRRYTLLRVHAGDRPHPPDPRAPAGDRPPGRGRPRVRPRRPAGPERQFLHAARLAFAHPVDRRARSSVRVAAARRTWPRRWRGGADAEACAGLGQPSYVSSDPAAVTRTRSCPGTSDARVPRSAGGHHCTSHTIKGAPHGPTSASELLEAGVHFGHQTRRWNPKMRRFIYGERGGIYIIDLLQTERLLAQAQEFVGDARRTAAARSCSSAPRSRRATPSRRSPRRCGMPYVNHRWLGGLLTNFQTINQRIKRLHDLERYEAEGQLALLPTRERIAARGRPGQAARQPRRRQEHAARRPTRCSSSTSRPRRSPCARPSACGSRSSAWSTPTATPTASTSSIPGNDDAIRSCDVITRALGDSIAEGARQWRAAEEARAARGRGGRRAEAEESARREAEEAARRSAAAEAQGAPRRPPPAGRRPRRRGRRPPRRPRPRRPQPQAAPAPAAPTPEAAACLGPTPRPTPTEAAPTRAAGDAARRDRGAAHREHRRSSASDVKELRERTGAGMMDCKNALASPTATSTRPSSCCASRARRQGAKLGEPRGHRGHRASPTSTPTARSACWSRSTATPTSSPATSDFIAFAKDIALHIAGRRAAATSPRTRSREDDQGRRAARLRAAGRRQAGEHPRREDRRGQAEEVARGGRAARPGARQRATSTTARRSSELRARRSRPRPARTSSIRRFARFAVGE